MATHEKNVKAKINKKNYHGYTHENYYRARDIFDKELMELGYGKNVMDKDKEYPKDKDDVKRTRELLIETQEIVAKKDKKLKEIGDALKKCERQDGTLIPNKVGSAIGNLEVTRQDLKEMGIVVKSELGCAFKNLPEHVKEELASEVSGALQEKVIMMLNTCFTEDKMADAKLKDAALALGILFDKFRVSEGKAEKTVEHRHTLGDLITKNSESDMTTIDVDASVIDVENEDDVVENQENE